MSPALSNGDVGLFASDMHLGDHDPRTAALFLEQLGVAWPSVTHIFLLGDLFEAWVGDDQPDAVVRDALALFARITASGCRLFAMRGNRDFLLDVPAGRFSALTGAVMLEDPCVATLFGEPVVLAHGDALCTDDTDYQRVRALVRGEVWQRQFLARPLSERLAMGRALRAESENARARRASSRANPSDSDDVVDDVNQGAVDEVLHAFGSVTVIHGHTHRPACHVSLLDELPTRRWVLPDWDAAVGRGGFLRVGAGGFTWQAMEQGQATGQSRNEPPEPI